jgi:hypothetical protein
VSERELLLGLVREWMEWNDQRACVTGDSPLPPVCWCDGGDYTKPCRGTCLPARSREALRSGE